MPLLYFASSTIFWPNTWYTSEAGYGHPAFKPAPIPEGRSRAVAAPIDDVHLAFALGRTFLFVTNTLHVYDRRTNSWAAKASAPGERQFGAAAPLGNGRFCAVGGKSNLGFLYGDNWVYDYLSDSWSVRAPMPTARAGLGGAALGPGRAAFFGGTGPYGVVAVNEVYDYPSNSWSVRASMPQGRAHLAGAPLRPNAAIALGGIDVQETARNDVYNHLSDSWSTRAFMPEASGSHVAAPLGYGQVLALNWYLYDEASDSWSAKAPSPLPIAYSAAATLEGRPYVLGGAIASVEDAVRMYVP